MEGGGCTAIIAYEVNYEDVDRFLNAWDRANDYLKEQPGYVGAALHQAASSNPSFRFINVASWQDDDAFRNATTSNGFREASGLLRPYRVHAAVYDQIRSC